MSEEKAGLVCEQKPPCPEPPTARMYWPGDKERVLCEKHASAAQNIAACLGMHLVVKPL